MSDGMKKTRVKAGNESQVGYDGDPNAPWAGYDGERMRRVGEIFINYGDKLPSWCRLETAPGIWTDVPRDRTGQRKPPVKPSAPARRAHPDTLPGQAPKRRLVELEQDEAELLGGPPVLTETAPAKAPGRASDRVVG